MRSRDSRAALLAADGKRVAEVGDGAITIGGHIVATNVVAAQLVGGEVWTITEARGEHALRRYSTDGAAVGDTVALGTLGAEVAMVGARGGAVHALVEGDRALEVTRTEATVRVAEIGGRERDRRLLFTGRGVVERRGAVLALRGRGLPLTFGVPPELGSSTVTGGGDMLGGTIFFVELQATGGGHLLVFDARRGDLRSRVRLGASRVLAIAETSGQLVIGCDRQIGLFEVARARFTHERVMASGAASIVVDARGRRFEIAADDGTESVLGPGLVEHAGMPQAPVAAALAPAEPAPEPESEPYCEPIVDSAEAPPPSAPGVAAAAFGSLESLGAPPKCLWPRATRHSLTKDRLRAHVADMFELVRSLCASAAARLDDEGDDEALEDDDAGEARARDAYAHWADQPTPLSALARDFGLSTGACTVLVVVAAPFLWGELAAVYREIAGDSERPLVDEHFVCQLLDIAVEDRGAVARELDASAPLVRHGLIKVGDGARPFAELTVHAEVRARLTTAGVRRPDREIDLARTDPVCLGDLAASLSSLHDDLPARVVIRGRAGSGRRELAEVIGAWARRYVEPVELAGAGLEALEAGLRRVHLAGSIACLSGIDHVAADPVLERRVQAVLDRHPGPLFLRCGHGTTPPLAPGYASAEIAALDRTQRIAAWQSALSAHGLSAAAAVPLAEAFAIGRAAAHAAAKAVVGASDRATSGGLVALLDRTIRQTRARRLTRIATQVTRLASRDDLVVPADIRESLEELVARVRLRAIVLEDWGLSRATSHGVTALFQGGPGTGKTLAAGVIARELGFDLYRVDLSQIVSKWIGETEKNLAELFDAAEDGRCVLLLDEADSLLARRNEVKSSNDRHANMEVNYILQRLDTFDGIAILTTNFGTSLDPALVRRLTVQLQFPFPDEEQREELWRAHLPPSLPATGELGLRELARAHPLSGGYIRNAALRAAFLAASAGEPLRACHLKRAVELGYRDRGALGRTSRQE